MTLKIHEDPSRLSFALGLVPEVLDVSYEFPGFWSIKTTKGEFHLGTANGCVGWDGPNGDSAETPATGTLAIVFAFAGYMSSYNPIKETNE